MVEGYFVMGFGQKYIDECEKMVETLKVFDSKRPVALMTHKVDEKYVNTKKIFDDIIYVDDEDIKDDNIHNSFCVRSRIHMPKYMPYDKIISLDSDMICLYNPQHAWDFFNNTDPPFMCCGFEYEKCWHWGRVDQVIQKVGRRIPSIHGGVLYFNKNHINFNRFYEYTKDALNNYDKYNCMRSFRGGMTDEVIFSIAMAKLDIKPLHYENYPIVSFNLPITIELPCYVQSRDGENTQKHILTKYPTIFNHLFFHEKSMPKERQIKLEGWYNDFHRKIINNDSLLTLSKKTIVCTMCTGDKFTSIKNRWSNIINDNISDCKIEFFTNITSNKWYNRLVSICNLYSESDTIVHIDMDCILMNNIDEILKLKEYNAIFSSENYGNNAFPKEYSNKLGFGICCGFFIINKITNSNLLLDSWLKKTKECNDDQIGIMKYICDNNYTISSINILLNKKSFNCKIIQVENIKILILNHDIIGRSNFIFKQAYGNHIIANNLLNKSLEYYIDQSSNESIIKNSICHCSNPANSSCGYCYNKKLPISKYVCVTSLYDIGRKDRNFGFYIDNIKKLLQFKMPLIIFCSNSTYNQLKDINREHYVQFIVREFEELDFNKKHYSEIKNNISSESYKRNVKHYGRPETVYPEYNIIQYSKFDFISEVKQIVNSEYYIWIDAGVPRFFDNVPTDIWPNYEKLNDKIIVQTFKEAEINEKFNKNFNDILNCINLENECKMSRYLIIGTTFVVPNKDVEWLKTKVNEKYNEMLRYGYLNNEQVAIEFVVKENLERFDVKINNSNNWYNMFKYI